MLTLPALVERPARDYIAVRRTVTLPFGAAIPGAMQALFAAVAAQGLTPVGPVFFKYNVVRMPELELEFGVSVSSAARSEGEVVAGVLPAGRYGEVTWFGPYDALMDVNAVLIGWARQCGHAWDMDEQADGEHFAARLEIYHTDPDEEPDPGKWETTVTIKLRD